MNNFIKKYGKLISFVYGFSIILFLLTFVINFGMEDFNFYKNFSTQYNLKEYADVSQDKLEKMYKSLQDQIISGDESDIKKYFNEREVSHMKDVHNLFKLNRNINRISMVLTIFLSSLVFYHRKNEENIKYIRYTRNSMLFILIVFLFFVGIVSINFEAAFIKFHELLFNNDLWLLNPETDIMIRMLPQEFFMSIAFRIFKLFIFIFGIIISSLSIYIFVKKRGKKNVSV